MMKMKNQKQKKIKKSLLNQKVIEIQKKNVIVGNVKNVKLLQKEKKKLKMKMMMIMKMNK